MAVNITGYRKEQQLGVLRKYFIREVNSEWEFARKVVSYITCQKVVWGVI